MLFNKRKELENEIKELKNKILELEQQLGKTKDECGQEDSELYLLEFKKNQDILNYQNTLEIKLNIINGVYKLVKLNFLNSDQIPHEVVEMVDWFFSVGQ